MINEDKEKVIKIQEIIGPAKSAEFTSFPSFQTEKLMGTAKKISEYCTPLATGTALSALRAMESSNILKNIMQPLSNTNNQLLSSINKLTSTISHIVTSSTGFSDLITPSTFNQLSFANLTIASLDTSLDTLKEIDEVEKEILLDDGIENESEIIICILSKIDPNLISPFNGAWEAYYTNNSDRQRHIFTSLRELWEHLLKTLSPDEMVMQWSKSYEFINNGRLSRNNRIEYRVKYLFRNIEEEIPKLIEAQINVIEELRDQLNELHQLKKLSEESLRYILYCSNSALICFLRICERHNLI